MTVSQHSSPADARRHAAAAAPAPRSGWRRLLRWAAGALAVACLLAVGGEIILRVAPGLSPEKRARDRIARLLPSRSPITRTIKAQEVAAKSTYIPVPAIGAVLTPNRQDTVVTPDYTFVRETDHAGFSNHDPWPGQVDAAVLGSSLVMGPGVGTDAEFSSLLEERFPGRTFLNLGVPGAGTELEARVDSVYAEPYHPAAVILAIWVVSDVDNSRTFAHWLREHPPQGFTEYRFNYWRTHPDTLPHDRLDDLLNRSALWRAASLTTRALLTRHHMRETVSFADGDTIDLSVRVQHRLAEGLRRADMPDLRPVFFDPLERLQRRVEARGGHFVVVLLPSKEEIYGADAYPPVRRTIEQVRDGLHARGIHTLDLYPMFQQWHGPHAPFFPTDIHYTVLGNTMIADAIAGWITREHVFATDTAAPTSAAP